MVVCCLVLVAIAVGLAVIAVGLYKASQHVPELYHQALQVDPAAQRQAGDEMFRRATALLSDVKTQDRWEALFTAEQINGWLAVNLPEKHPGTLPKFLGDPRVAIEPDRIMLFARFQKGDFTSVITLTVEPYVPEPNVLALRICRIRAGAVPWRLDKILEAVSEAARREDLHLKWRQADGDPVALISIPSQGDGQDRLVQIEAVQLGEGEIYLSGTTKAR